MVLSDRRGMTGALATRGGALAAATGFVAGAATDVDAAASRALAASLPVGDGWDEADAELALSVMRLPAAVR